MQLTEGLPRGIGFIIIPDDELNAAMTLDLARGYNIDPVLRDIYCVLREAFRCPR